MIVYFLTEECAFETQCTDLISLPPEGGGAQLTLHERRSSGCFDVSGFGPEGIRARLLLSTPV